MNPIRDFLSNRNGLISGAAAAIILLIVVLIDAIRPDTGRALVSEGALVEAMSAALWFLAGLITFHAAYRRLDARFDLFILGYVMVLFGFRELDFHTRFTRWNMGQLIKYTKSYIPLSVRLTGFAFVIVPLAIAIFLFVTRWRRRLVQGWREQAPWVISLVWWVALAGLSRVADKLSGLPSEYMGQNHWLFRATEESAEFGVVLLTLLLAIPLRHVRKATVRPA